MIDWESPQQRRALAELIEPDEYSRQWTEYRATAGRNIAERWIGVVSLIELQWLGHIVAEPGRMHCHTWCEENLLARDLISVSDGKCVATPSGQKLLEIERDRWREKHDGKDRKA